MINVITQDMPQFDLLFKRVMDYASAEYELDVSDLEAFKNDIKSIELIDDHVILRFKDGVKLHEIQE